LILLLSRAFRSFFAVAAALSGVDGRSVVCSAGSARSFETKQIHAGAEPDAMAGARAV
jgi:hypothetical protein